MWLPDTRVRAMLEAWKNDSAGEWYSGRTQAARELEALIEETQQPKSPPSIGSARCMAYGGEQDIEVKE